MLRLALAATLLVSAVPLAAQGPAKGQGPGTRRSAANGAGWVDARFRQAARDRDGQLTRGEVTAAVNRAHPGRLSTGRSRILTNFWFDRLDGDRSNAVTLREARAAAAEYQARFDRNRNGRIDPAERRGVDAFLRNPAR